MDYRVRETEGGNYIELISATEPLGAEQDALDLIALCWEHEVRAIVIHYAALSNDFFNLKTRVAGEMMQKFVNYGIKVAVVAPNEAFQEDRFKEMARETNKGNQVGVFDSIEAAESWLL